MVEPKTLSSLTLCQAVEPHATLCTLAVLQVGDRVLTAHWSRLADMGWPKAARLGHLTGPESRRLLWPWALVWPDGIVNFLISFSIIQIRFNSIFGFILNSSQFVQT
jgi:hypothetical protein